MILKGGSSMAIPPTPTPTPRSPRRPSLKATAAESTLTTRSRTAKVSTPVAVIDPEHRRALIAQAAYYRAEKRSFAPGFEVEDWLSAESEVDTLLTLGTPKTGN
jgi:hypothetical protein